MNRLFCLLFLVLLGFSRPTLCQNDRISTRNHIGWYNYFGTVKLSEKWGIHTEYQWRRTEFITRWQQSLLRLGINYQVSPGILARVGYGWIETFAYGPFPLNVFGKDFSEHRIFEMIQLNHKERQSDFSHRFMFEQRFVGKYSSAQSQMEDDFPLLYRMRYMFRFQIPLTKLELSKRTLYTAFYNEVFLSFGKQVNANVFDQNRLAFLLGYRINETIRLEGGYLNQILQYGRKLNGQNIFQYNNGLILNAYFNLDLSKKEKM